MDRTSDIFTAYYPVYLISLLFGQAPYFIEGRDKNKTHFKFSRRYFILFSAIHIIVVIYINYMWLYWLQTFTNTSLLYDVTQKLLDIAASAAISSQFILSKLYANNFTDTFNELRKIEQVLKGKFEIEIPHKKIAFVSVILLSVCGILDIVGMTGAALSVFSDGNYILFATSVVMTYALVALQIIHGQFLNGILIYRSLFSGISRYLIRFLDTLPLYSPIRDADETKCVQVLRCLSKIHQELCENLREFKKILSIQLLLSFTFHYVQMSLYTFVWIIAFPSVGEENLIIFMMMTFVQTAIILKLLASIINSHLCINEMSKLMQSLYKVATLKSFRVKTEANNFALQLFHEKIEITAAGFFDIDIKIIYSIVAAVTTHTIILIQFDSKVNVFENLLQM